jgi:hypothetical protein
MVGLLVKYGGKPVEQIQLFNAPATRRKRVYIYIAGFVAAFFALLAIVWALSRELRRSTIRHQKG